MGAVEYHTSKRRTINLHEKRAGSAHDDIIGRSILAYLDQLAELILEPIWRGIFVR